MSYVTVRNDNSQTYFKDNTRFGVKKASLITVDD
jgi:hypothetical protein